VTQKYKILLLLDNYRFMSDRLFFGFVKNLDRFCDLKMYGPQQYNPDKVMYQLPEDITLMPYEKDITGLDLVKEYNPDVILLQLYNQKNLEWYPSDICKAGVPTVLLEDDHYTYNPELSKYKGTKPLEWYKRSGLSLLLRRHFYRERAPIPSVWLPQSANEKEFTPYYGERVPYIGFAGSFEPTPWYEIRRKAVEKISDARLLSHKFGKFVPEEYVIYIREHAGVLGCSGGILHTPLAKMFECMLSNTPYLTNWFHHSHLLLGLKEYCFIYKDDCSDVVAKAKIILNEKDYVAEVTKNALEVTLKEHTHDIRIRQLYDILKAVIKGKEPPRVWGV